MPCCVLIHLTDLSCIIPVSFLVFVQFVLDLGCRCISLKRRSHKETPADGLYHWLAESTHQATADTALADADGP